MKKGINHKEGPRAAGEKITHRATKKTEAENPDFNSLLLPLCFFV